MSSLPVFKIHSDSSEIKDSRTRLRRSVSLHSHAVLWALKSPTTRTGAGSSRMSRRSSATGSATPGGRYVGTANRLLPPDDRVAP